MSESADIFSLIKKGDKKAFESLFRSLYSGLCTFATKYVADVDEVEDIVQDVFFTIWMKRNKIHIKQNIDSYLYASVRNKCLMYIQHQKIINKYNNYSIYITNNRNEVRDDLIEYRELSGIVDKTLDSFPDRMREIFILSRYEGLKYNEIARQLSLSVKTVEANITRALKIFRKKLGNYMDVMVENN